MTIGAVKSIGLIMSSELMNFNTAIGDAQILLDMHDSLTASSRGKPDHKLEVYKRSALILAITAWEAFIEDTIKSEGKKIILAASSPVDLLTLFHHCAASWKDEKPRNAPDFKEWCGDGWKSILNKKLNADVDALNTPGSANISTLSKRYLNLDVTKYWSWNRMSTTSAKRKLDDFIVLRGALVHRGRELGGNAAVKRKDVESVIGFLPKLVERTENALKRGPRPFAAV